MDRRSSKNDISIFYENRNKLIFNLIDSNVPFSSIAGKFKISKSNVSYIKSKRDKNNLSNGNNNKKSRKSRGADILVEDFDSGVISVLSGTTTSSPFGSDSDGPQNFRKAIKCAARTYAEREGRTNFKASEGWVEKFLMRNYPGFVEANKSKRQKTSPPTDSFQGSQQLISNIGAANNVSFFFAPTSGKFVDSFCNFLLLSGISIVSGLGGEQQRHIPI